MVYNGTDYNEKWVLGLTLEQFIGHVANEGKSEAQLTQLWHLIQDKNVPMYNERSLYGNYNGQAKAV